MRTLTNGLAGHIAGTAHKRAVMLRLDLVDGSTLAVTDHDNPIGFDLGDGEVEYTPRTGILPSDISLSTGFDPDDFEVTGPITETGLTTRTAILGGRFDGAVARLFQVNHSAPSQGAIKLLKGEVVMAEAVDSTFKLTVNSQIARFAQQVGRIITGYCDADFGDARCGYTVVPLAATVTAVTDDRTFTVSFTGTYADNYFNRGTVTFTSGDLNGCRPVEVFDWSAAGAVALWTSLPESPSIGDTLQLRQGCGKTRAACLVYDNVVNFRGFPDVPGTDQIMKFPDGT